MNYNYRLTVHVEDAEKTRVETGKHVYQHKGTTYKDSNAAPNEAKRVKEIKEKIFTTLSFYYKSKRECFVKLSSLRTDYTIAKGKDYKNKKKFDKELWQISFIN
tara:strand:+ start:206 stop:517 length:312 start_codon:yes stop_codon:yes gene_type:complete